MLDLLTKVIEQLATFLKFPTEVSNFLIKVVDFAWGLPLVILLIGGGIILIVYSQFIPLKGFAHAFKLLFGRFQHKNEKAAEGQLSHFKALSNALAATIGLGNIGGVAVAISQGGPGAIFWMWIAALIGMNTKFFECSLAVMFRGKDYNGEVQGGPMYVIEQQLPKAFKFLSIFFAVFGLLGTMALFQVNQLSSYVYEEFQIEKIYVGLLSAILVFVVLKGGIQRLANVTSSLVPIMCVFYVICCLIIWFMNIEQIPAVFAKIFTSAFTGEAMFGGATGIGIIAVLQVGVKRAAFSNEAGVGTAPMAHSNAKTAEPISEGLVAMLGPFFDTIIVCTMTAITILVSLSPEQLANKDGILMTTQAFENSLPGFGSKFLGLAILLFAFTTMLGMANYNQKCWDYLFKGRKFLRHNTFRLWFCTTLIIGSVASIDDVVSILDIGYGFMAWPNMFATLYLAPRVIRHMKDYFQRFDL